MKDVWTQEAETLLAAVKEDMKTEDDAVAVELVKVTTAAGLAKLDEKFSELSSDEMHAVIATLIANTTNGDGIEFRGAELGESQPVWIAATIAEAGRLPSERPSDRRWIRLDRITTVYAHPSIASSDDERDWLYSLTVVADGREYHATPVRLRGAAALDAVDKVLRAVARIVK